MSPDGHEEEELPEAIDRRYLWRLLALVRPYRGVFASCLLLALVATACELAVPWATKITIDRAVVPPWRAAARASAPRAPSTRPARRPRPARARCRAGPGRARENPAGSAPPGSRAGSGRS